MTIEIQRPELEALIQERMASGAFPSIEDVLMEALKASPHSAQSSTQVPRKQNLADFLMESPLHGSGLVIKRAQDDPRPPEFWAGS